MAVLRARHTFHAPGNVLVQEGELRDGNDALVASYPTMFESVDAAVRRGSDLPIEEATARPGQKRNTR